MANVKRASSQLTTFGLRKEEALVTLLGESQDQLTLGMAGAGATGAYLPLAGGTLTGQLTAQRIQPDGDLSHHLGYTGARWYNVFLYQILDGSGVRFAIPTNGSASPNTYRDGSTDSATTVAHIFDTANALNTSGALLMSFRNAGVEKAGINRNGAFFSGSAISVPAVYPYSSTSLFLYPLVPDGASAVGLVVDNLATLSTTGAKLLSLRNNGTEKAHFTKDGTLTLSSGAHVYSGGDVYTTSGGVFRSLGAATAYLTANVADGANVAIALNNDTSLTNASAKLLSLRNNGTEKAYFDKDGQLYVGGSLVGGGAYLPLAGGTLTGHLHMATGKAIYSDVADSGSAVGTILDTANNFSSSTGKLVSIRNAGVEKVAVSTNGIVYAAGGFSNASTTARVFGNMADGATAVAVSLGPAGLYSAAGSRLLSVTNNGTTAYFTVDKDGEAYATTSQYKVWHTGNLSLAAYAPIASPTFTGTVTTSALTVNSTLTLGNIWGYLNSGFAFRDGGVGTLSFYTSGGAASGASINLSTGQVNGTSGVFSSTLSSGALTVTGAITATGNITAYYSDRRLKRDIRPIPGALAKLDRLRGVEWAWDEMACFNAGFKPDTATDYGFVAQELEYVLPNAVGPNGAFLAVKASNQGVLALAVEAIKELRSEVAMLRARVEELERE